MKRIFLSSLTSELPDSSELQQLRWVIDVRWCALIGQVIVFFAAALFLDLSITPVPLLVVAAAVAMTNELARSRGGDWLRAGLPVLPAMTVLDVILLTVLLFSYGGYTNPFSLVYLVHVVLAALLLGRSWTWIVTALCSVSYAALFWFYIPVAELSHQHGSHLHHAEHLSDGVSSFDLHLYGMLVGFILSAVLLSFFVGKLRREVDTREHALRDRRINEAKLAALTTLAASVAHELRTPLAALRLSVDDLRRGVVPAEETKVTLEMMHHDLERAAGALGRLSDQWSELDGEALAAVTPAEIQRAVAAGLGQQNREIDWRITAEMLAMWVPPRATAHVIESLIRNAIEASTGQHSPVIVSAVIEQDSPHVLWRVEDRGCGMSEQQLARVGEPFFSERDGAKGMGLGLFITQLYVQRYRGALSIVSAPGEGTVVEIRLPTCASASDRGVSERQSGEFSKTVPTVWRKERVSDSSEGRCF